MFHRDQGKGRVFYTAWGHDQRTWSNHNFQVLLENAIRWASQKATKGLRPRCGKALILPPPGLPRSLRAEGEPVCSWVPSRAVPPVIVSGAADLFVSPSALFVNWALIRQSFIEPANVDGLNDIQERSKILGIDVIAGGTELFRLLALDRQA